MLNEQRISFNGKIYVRFYMNSIVRKRFALTVFFSDAPPYLDSTQKKEGKKLPAFLKTLLYHGPLSPVRPCWAVYFNDNVRIRKGIKCGMYLFCSNRLKYHFKTKIQSHQSNNQTKSSTQSAHPTTSPHTNRKKYTGLNQRRKNRSLGV